NVSFSITNNDNTGIFTVAPAVDAYGNLTFTLSGTSGVANITLKAVDTGGITNGGINESATQSFKIAATGFTVTESSGHTETGENESTDSFDVVLDVQPASDVVIDITGLDA